MIFMVSASNLIKQEGDIKFSTLRDVKSKNLWEVSNFRPYESKGLTLYCLI